MGFSVETSTELSRRYWLSGLDEAGYGPLLGPLVVSLATIGTPERIVPRKIWSALAPTVSRKLSKKRIAVADSKKLYRGKGGDLSSLETGVLAFLAIERGGSAPRTFRELVDHLTMGRGNYLDEYPWYQGQDFSLPVSVSLLELVGCVRRLERILARRDYVVAELRSIPVEVTEFNRTLARRDSKGEVNAWAMGRFFNWLWRQDDRTVSDVYTDRLGGRQRYGPLLYPLFPGASFQILEQTVAHQAYRVTAPGRSAQSDPRELTVHFRKDGENHSFVTALASMTSKYVRELHMRLLNKWWAEHEPTIRPTAGYPQDARRFLEDIDPLRKRLGIGRGLLVRNR